MVRERAVARGFVRVVSNGGGGKGKGSCIVCWLGGCRGWGERYRGIIVDVCKIGGDNALEVRFRN